MFTQGDPYENTCAGTHTSAEHLRQERFPDPRFPQDQKYIFHTAGIQIILRPE